MARDVIHFVVFNSQSLAVCAVSLSLLPCISLSPSLFLSYLVCISLSSSVCISIYCECWKNLNEFEIKSLCFSKINTMPLWERCNMTTHFFLNRFRCKCVNCFQHILTIVIVRFLIVILCKLWIKRTPGYQLLKWPNQIEPNWMNSWSHDQITTISFSFKAQWSLVQVSYFK